MSEEITPTVGGQSEIPAGTVSAETPDATPSHEQLLAGETGNPPVVLPFTRDMIEAFLKHQKLRFLRDEEGDFLVIFRVGGDVDIPEVRVWMLANGKQQEIYSIRASMLAPRAQDSADCLRLCNAWNERRRWPKAYVGQEEGVVHLYLEHQIDLEAGIHQELFDDFTLSGLTGISGFIEWLRENMPSLAEPVGMPNTEQTEELELGGTLPS